MSADPWDNGGNVFWIFQVVIRLMLMAHQAQYFTIFRIINNIEVLKNGFIKNL